MSMTDAKPYRDRDGDPVSLDRLVRDEPEWAANRIRVGNEALDAKQAEVERWRLKATRGGKSTLPTVVALKRQRDEAKALLREAREMHEEQEYIHSEAWNDWGSRTDALLAKNNEEAKP